MLNQKGIRMKKTNILLLKEFEEYVAKTPMNDDEFEALTKWVEAGNSVHENGSMASYEGGYPMDFLDVYREEEEIRQKLDSLEGKEREKFLRELRGEKNAEDLQEELDHCQNLLGVYEYVLRKHHLLQEAQDEAEAARLRSEEFVRACRESNADLEMPFEEVI